MSQTKYSMPDDIKSICINYVRGYNRRVTEYHDRLDMILHATPKQSGVYIGATNQINRPSESRVDDLEKLENHIETKRMRAVEQAKHGIGTDLPDKQREKLMVAIWDSCIYGRNFVLAHYHLPMGHTQFYERRREFLWNIAVDSGYLI